MLKHIIGSCPGTPATSRDRDAVKSYFDMVRGCCGCTDIFKMSNAFCCGLSPAWQLFVWIVVLPQAIRTASSLLRMRPMCCMVVNRLMMGDALSRRNKCSRR